MLKNTEFHHSILVFFILPLDENEPLTKKNYAMQQLFSKPSFIVDENKCRRNIATMIAKAKKHHLIFRPHFKTHHSNEIGRWFREMGTNKITVSSLDMARYFASDGWDDITVAFPVNWLEIDKINELSSKINLNLLIESIGTVNFLKQNLKNNVGVFIKIDTGYHRTGVSVDNTTIISALINEIKNASHLKLKGFLAHNGHTYKTNSIKEIEEIHLGSLRKLSKLKAQYQDQETPLIVSIGDTPGASTMDNFEGADELRPGNFVFYDLVQQQLGSCGFKDISVSMACPVVAKHPDRNTIIIYGGGVHLSKESLKMPNGEQLFGKVVRLKEKGWTDPIPDCYLSSISQEHGVITASDSLFNSLNMGELIGILPVHSCMTADLQNAYFNFEGIKIQNHRSC
ncbi:MAG: alanine racemase [Bacteroidetes bacterium HGW-Bacteroidetes-17]|nr:MAG: alanine racemase [Bacteroidetes bacterium HGW-Bacteroidetes-17]